jgi:hypothetical protein
MSRQSLTHERRPQSSAGLSLTIDDSLEGSLPSIATSTHRICRSYALITDGPYPQLSMRNALADALLLGGAVFLPQFFKFSPHHEIVRILFQ